MRAYNLVTEGSLELVETPAPVIGAPDQVLIRVRAVGVCGSEVHAFQGSHPFRKAPVILGHEVAGEVLAVGGAVAAFRPGDRVFVDPQWTCGVCEYCQTGMPNLCPEKKVLGTQVWPGGFGEMILAPSVSVFHLPESLSFQQGCLIEPLTVAIHVVGRSVLRPGNAAAVLGTGSIGGLVVGVLKAMGADPIITADIRQHCLDAACRSGGTHNFLLPNPRLVDDVMAVTNGHGVDAVYVTADDAHLVNLGIQMSRRLARLVLVSLITDEPLQFQAFEVLSKEISIVGSLMANHKDVKTAINLASTGVVDVGAILTHTLPIERVQEGMHLAQTKANNAIKVVLNWT